VTASRISSFGTSSLWFLPQLLRDTGARLCWNWSIMNALKTRFRINASQEPDSSFAPLLCPTNPAVQFTFRAFEAPPPPPLSGSFEHDKSSEKYQHSWDDWTAFETWRAQEQREKCIEFRLVKTYSGLPEFERQLRYVCSRAGTGGIKPYSKLHPEWNRKIPSKRTDCKCTLLVKQYPGISTVLGNYSDTHDHPIGNLNLPFVQIPKETREYIAGLLRIKVAPDHIVCFYPMNFSLMLTVF
jgi:hypothetical protein